ncbi:MAG: hypothetical protein JNL07_07390, partial [Rhodospirillales bacterium]|nr:hypothetical protein [Rhodospirillales bacterium]
TIDDDSGDLRITAAGLARTTPPTAAAAPPLDSGIAAARCALPTAGDGPARVATAAAAMPAADPVAAPALGAGLASAPQPPPQATWPMSMMDAARPAPIPAPGTEPVMGRPGQTTGRAKPKPS